MVNFFWLLLGILGVWRLTHLFHAEDGPWNLLRGLRRILGTGFWGGLVDCFYCLSLWVAAPFAWFVGEGMKEKLFLWPALSAGAILLERVTSRQEEVPPAPYIEQSEDQDVLRTQKRPISAEQRYD